MLIVGLEAKTPALQSVDVTTELSLLNNINVIITKKTQRFIKVYILVVNIVFDLIPSQQVITQSRGHDRVAY